MYSTIAQICHYCNYWAICLDNFVSSYLASWVISSCSDLNSLNSVLCLSVRHTAIVAYGDEFFFGGEGISSCSPVGLRLSHRSFSSLVKQARGGNTHEPEVRTERLINTWSEVVFIPVAEIICSSFQCSVLLKRNLQKFTMAALFMLSCARLNIRFLVHWVWDYGNNWGSEVYHMLFLWWPFQICLNNTHFSLRLFRSFRRTF